MTHKIYSIRDQKAEYFTQPFYSKTHGEAERQFTTWCNDPQTAMHKFPEDFDLYHIGTLDDQTGKIDSLDTPHHIVKAVQIKQTNIQ